MLKKGIFRFFVAMLVSVSSTSYGQKIRLRHYDTTSIHEACHRLVSRYADDGYPFASVVTDSAVMTGRRHVDVYCSTILSQKYQSPYYIYMTTGIAPGDIYNESRILLAARRITSDGAAVALQDAEAEFHPGGAADVYLYLKSHRTNVLSAGFVLNRSADDGNVFTRVDFQ